LSATRIVVVGAGMGGLAAALRLARRGYAVRVMEARSEPGGLASRFESDGFAFDAGPYVLLDRPGLEWALRCLDGTLLESLDLSPIPDVYEVSRSGELPVRILSSLDETVAGLEAGWPGSGQPYRRFITRMAATHRSLQPLLRVSQPGPMDLLRSGAWKGVPFLLRPLASVLARTRLPAPVIDALAIWTHVAGQRLEEAPSPLAFVPALIHTVGAFYPAAGIGVIPRTLARAAAAAGVEFEYETRVRSIRVENGRVRGVESSNGRITLADAVVSNAGGVGTYLDLVRSALPEGARRSLEQLPLQSPGVCAYLAIEDDGRPPYLRFFLPPHGGTCRLLVRPAALTPAARRGSWSPARLLAPLDHATAEALGPAGQREHLDALLAETWWREGMRGVRVLARRTPAEWGAEFHLHRSSMNPVMTSRFMRQGRLAHRSPWIRGLYLAGSATHPGQWVSFCAISGILAADRVAEDVAPRA
jgi:phytoene dehydrogenase-like protein